MTYTLGKMDWPKKGDIYLELLQFFWELEIPRLCADRCFHLISNLLLIFIEADGINYL